MKNNKYTYSTNEEWWSNDIDYNSLDEATTAGKNDPKCIELGRFFVGLVVPIDKEFLTTRTKLFDIERFNEDISENAGGDEDYADERANSEHLDSLNDLIAEYILKHFHTTMSFTIEDSVEIII